MNNIIAFLIGGVLFTLFLVGVIYLARKESKEGGFHKK